MRNPISESALRNSRVIDTTSGDGVLMRTKAFQAWNTMHASG
jgi:hypothetical protein